MRGRAARRGASHRTRHPCCPRGSRRGAASLGFPLQEALGARARARRCVPRRGARGGRPALKRREGSIPAPRRAVCRRACVAGPHDVGRARAAHQHASRGAASRCQHPRRRHGAGRASPCPASLARSLASTHHGCCERASGALHSASHTCTVCSARGKLASFALGTISPGLPVLCTGYSGIWP